MKGASVARVNVALTNAGATALKATAAEASLLGKPVTEASVNEAARLAMGICEPSADQRGDVAYKTAMCGEMTRRALLAAHSRAGKP
jgi:carbon-monoxide dehydrogenase medium subunit